jgi:hypothetical protein
MAPAEPRDGPDTSSSGYGEIPQAEGSPNAP